jgi:hypothetical protein
MNYFGQTTSKFGGPYVAGSGYFAPEYQILRDPNCPKCAGEGWYWVPNGPDDCDKELCDCAEVVNPC